MFTLEQLNDIHNRLGTMESFSQYVRALQALGVETYDSYVADGHSEFFGKDGHKVVSPSVHNTLPIRDGSEPPLAHTPFGNRAGYCVEKILVLYYLRSRIKMMPLHRNTRRDEECQHQENRML